MEAGAQLVFKTIELYAGSWERIPGPRDSCGLQGPKSAPSRTDLRQLEAKTPQGEGRTRASETLLHRPRGSTQLVVRSIHTFLFYPLFSVFCSFVPLSNILI